MKMFHEGLIYLDWLMQNQTFLKSELYDCVVYIWAQPEKLGTLHIAELNQTERTLMRKDPHWWELSLEGMGSDSELYYKSNNGLFR